MMKATFVNCVSSLICQPEDTHESRIQLSVSNPADCNKISGAWEDQMMKVTFANRVDMFLIFFVNLRKHMKKNNVENPDKCDQISGAWEEDQTMKATFAKPCGHISSLLCQSEDTHEEKLLRKP